jgi:hypothetical protein
MKYQAASLTRDKQLVSAPGIRLALVAALATLAVLVIFTGGTAGAETTRPGSGAHGGPPVPNLIVYATHTQTLSANGASLQIVACPPGALPVGGGTAVQDPRIHVTQAGFYASGPRRIVGYQASVRVGGLRRGGKTRFGVQVACLRAPALVIYVAHVQVLSANGTGRVRVRCPAGGLPVGGGTDAQDPRIEQVTQAGFYVGAAGRMVGYQASARVRGLRRGGRVRLAVQVACAPAPAPFPRATVTVARAIAAR